MAHEDYDCCAVCDTEMAYNGYDAATKADICSNCVANLAMHGVIVHDVDELETWMETEKPEVVISVLDDVGFQRCFYRNYIDDMYERLEKTKGGRHVS